MSTIFPLFSSFPNEIQELIWDAAVRPVPGRQQVQRFIITDHYLNQANPRYPISGDFIRFGHQDGPRFGFSLALPWHDPQGNPNESGYAMDSCLWTACIASRAAMIRRFKKNEWWSYVPQEESTTGFAEKGAYAGQDGVFHSATYKTREGEIRHITISTEDLIYLDPRYLDSVDWFHHYAGDPIPLIDYCGEDGARTTPSFLGLNIAIDFDPRMMDMLANRPVHYCRGDLGMYSMSMVDMVDVLHESGGRTLWFIDHRLQRRPSKGIDSTAASLHEEAGAEVSPSISTLDIKRQVFHAASYILVEVRREDMELWSIDTNDESDNDASSVFDFFDVLFQTGYGRLDIQNSSRMRVLAYQGTANEALKGRGPYEVAPNPSCLTCYPKEEIPRVRPVKPSTSMGSDDAISLSDLNLFDSE